MLHSKILHECIFCHIGIGMFASCFKIFLASRKHPEQAVRLLNCSSEDVFALCAVH